MAYNNFIARRRQMKIIRQTMVVNGRSKVSYLYEGNEYSDVRQILSHLYKDLGDFYEKQFGVSREDAFLAGWNPNKDFFSDDYGWYNFLKDKGKIIKNIITEEVELNYILFGGDK